MKRKRLFIVLLAAIAGSCSKEPATTPTPVPPVETALRIKSASVNGTAVNNATYYNISTNPAIQYSFSAPLNRGTVQSAVSVKNSAGANVPYTATYSNSDSNLQLQLTAPLQNIAAYTVTANTSLKSVAGKNLSANNNFTLVTKIDSAAKFPMLSDDALLDLVQQQTFKYFWDYGHPVSGLARERSNGDNDVVTSGGSGFGIMAIPVAVSRNFITRADGLIRMQKIVGFLKNTAVKIKGAFPHWMNGNTGAVVPFSATDDGADLVETSYLMAGLLTARQYFSGTGAGETALRNDINTLWNGVEWDWFRQGGQDVLYWHYSEGQGWIMNFPIRGWNECLITYIMAASSTTHSVPASVYTNGWAASSSFTNGNTYYGYPLPLGPPSGGPLFLSQYSFLGVDPNGLQDVYANYATQTKNHTLINYNYCVANPGNNFGYSDNCWGLTASDIKNGYTASSPTNDVGVIAPTAALASFPYTPTESMKALKFFYYTLGDKIWKEYGFVDAFALKDAWFAGSFLAIDQGPIIVMIENYRSQLLWNLLTSCPEVKTGMRTLGFTAPYL